MTRGQFTYEQIVAVWNKLGSKEATVRLLEQKSLRWL